MLAHAHPANTQVQDDLAASHMNMGNVLSDLGRRADALVSFQRALPIRERLAKDNPAVHQFQSGLAACLDNIGGLLFAMGNRTEAMASHRRALEIIERLARNHPTVTQFQDDLAICSMNLGNLYLFMGQPAEAIQSFSRSLEIYEQLVRDHPTVPNYHSSLGGALNNMAMIEIGQKRWPQARRLLDRAVAQQRDALAALPRHPVYRQFLRNHLCLLAAAHRALNQPVEAVRAAREWAELVRGNPADLYNAACSLALSVPLAQGEQSQALATDAVQMLKEAVAAGWNDAPHTSRDPDLNPLRDREDFRRLLDELFDRTFPPEPFAP
jgi:tetratricopeptide (TPR) repeat protein